MQRLSRTTYDGEIVSVTESYKNKQYGFDEKGFSEVTKLAKQIYKPSNVNLYVSYNTILNSTIDWLFKKYKNKKLKQSLCDFITNKISKSIKPYNIYFPVLFLDIDKTLQIGNVRITYFTKEQLQAIKDNFLQNHPDKKGSADALINYLKGKVFAVVGMKAEPEKVKEMAYHECLLAIDCMRICSPIMGYPKMKSDFDLERNSSVVLQTDSILQPCNNMHEFIMTKSRNATIYDFDELEFKNMTSMQLGRYHHFLKQSKRTSEIEKLILGSIRLFSEALKEKILQTRISKLFTIYESLILQNSEQGILNSIVRYAPKLIFDTTEDRDEMAKILKELYKVRSANVHHAKLIKVNNEYLKRLQIGLSMLLNNLILLSKKYKTKDSIIKQIELEMNSSFKLWEEIGRKKQERK